MIYVHPGVPSFAIVVSPDGLVVDGPGWTRPNGAGDLCSHWTAGLRQGWTVCNLQNQLLEGRPYVFRWKEGKCHHLPHELVYIVSLLIRYLKIFKDNILFKLLLTFVKNNIYYKLKNLRWKASVTNNCIHEYLKYIIF